MELTYIISAALLGIATLLPLIPNQHWIFRVFDFGRKQIFYLQLALGIAGLIFLAEKSIILALAQLLLIACLAYNFWVLVPYSSLFRTRRKMPSDRHADRISILSVNVYQFNEAYDRLITLVREVNPDILFTVESNQAWEDALSVLEDDFQYSHKKPLENTYGMHFYTQLKVRKAQTHFLVSDDLPSFEIELEAKDQQQFTFWGIHPPPPSPTEEPTSKERDGELLSVAKRVSQLKHPVVVVGDFNVVVWSRPSVLFRKTSGLIDGRIGRGLVSTFHADYPFLRFPIDLFYHSAEIFVEKLHTLRHIGSDHLPLFCQFFIHSESSIQEEKIESLQKEEKKEVKQLIDKGLEEEGGRDSGQK